MHRHDMHEDIQKAKDVVLKIQMMPRRCAEHTGVTVDTTTTVVPGCVTVR
jgi:hypothetical protein